MDRGELVPDDVILGIMREELAQPRVGAGVILDGVVRTVPQAEGAAHACSASLGRKLDAVLLFEIDNERDRDAGSAGAPCARTARRRTRAARPAACATNAAARSCAARTTSPRRCATGSSLRHGDRAGDRLVQAGTATRRRRRRRRRRGRGRRRARAEARLAGDVIQLKSAREIELMAQGGKILARHDGARCARRCAPA